MERVVKETGQTEDTFLILEKIVQESKRSEKTSEGGQKDKRLNLVHVPNDSCSTSQSGQKDQKLRKDPGSQGRTKENIKPRPHGAGTNGLGHRRQCSNSETQTQQVQQLFFLMFVCVCLLLKGEKITIITVFYIVSLVNFDVSLVKILQLPNFVVF